MIKRIKKIIELLKQKKTNGQVVQKYLIQQIISLDLLILGIQMELGGIKNFKDYSNMNPPHYLGYLVQYNYLIFP